MIKTPMRDRLARIVDDEIGGFENDVAQWQHALTIVDRLLTALRTPDDTMVRRVVDCTDLPYLIWQEMIDAARES